MPRRKSNRSDGRFEIKRTVGHRFDGKAIRKSFYGKNEAEALLAYQRYLAGEKQKKEKREKITLREWMEEWLEVYKRPDVKGNTFITSYLNPCKRYIFPHFENYGVAEITQMQVKAFLNFHTHLSQSTLDKILGCLRDAFECAIDNDLIEKNPCRGLRVKSCAEKVQKRTYDRQSAEALCQIEHKYGVFVHILIALGLRCSELCGLRWQDVDFEGGYIHIKQALTEEGGIITISDPKSATSKRTLPVPPDLMERLKELKSRPKTKAVEKEYVAAERGRHFSPDSFGTRQLSAFYDAVGIPADLRLSPHELRHTCGTLLYQKTKDIYHVSRFLGHADVSVTSKIYVHSELQQKAVNLDDFLTT